MARWDPWSDLLNFQNEVARVVNDHLNPQGLPMVRVSPLGSGAGAPKALLPVDIRQSESEFTVEAAVAGFAPNEVEVVADQGHLTIKAEHESDKEQSDGYVYRERSVRSFYRQLSLPPDAKESDITAEFKDGLLLVHIPRVPAPAPRRISVSTGRGTGVGGAEARETIDAGRPDSQQPAQLAGGSSGS